MDRGVYSAGKSGQSRVLYQGPKISGQGVLIIRTHTVRKSIFNGCLDAMVGKLQRQSSDF